MNNKQIEFTCPCCLQHKTEKQIKKTVNILKKLKEQKSIAYYANVGNDFFDIVGFNQYEWACDECLGRGKAIHTKPEVQKYIDYKPYLAYFDSKKVCKTCGSNFLFKKEEKQFWYEELNFWVQSKPNKCLECRKDLRAYKRLSIILENGESLLSVDDLREVIKIYTAFDKIEKVKYFQSILKKNNRCKATRTDKNYD